MTANLQRRDAEHRYLNEGKQPTGFYYAKCALPHVKMRIPKVLP